MNVYGLDQATVVKLFLYSFMKCQAFAEVTMKNVRSSRKLETVQRNFVQLRNCLMLAKIRKIDGSLARKQMYLCSFINCSLLHIYRVERYFDKNLKDAE